MKKTNEELEKEVEVDVIAERVRLLWQFLADLIPYKETLKEVSEKASERSSTVLSVAPILTASGQDYEEVYLQREVERKRADALCNLINVLDETEKERIEFYKRKDKEKEEMVKIQKILGI